MQIPIKVDYGVRALVDLALHPEDEPIRATEIAARTAIPEPYLAQVFHALSRSGLVRSYRGPQGGHALAMSPGDIKLSMVMACLGGTDNLVACLDIAGTCVHIPTCAQREIWRSVEQAVNKILDSTTVADLAQRSLEIESEQRDSKRDMVTTA